MDKEPDYNTEAGKKRLAFVMEKALIASFIGHICFIPLFCWLRIPEMVVVNFISATSLFFSVSFTRKKKYLPAFIIGTVEMITHAIVAVYYVGWVSGFHYYLLVLAPMVFFWPNWRQMTKVSTSLTLYLIYGGLYLFSQNYSPVYSVEAWKLQMTTLFNALVAFSTFASVTLYYQSNVEAAERHLREANSRLDELANKDPLTDLHNRRTIVERIDDQENRSHDDGKQFSIIMADIDHFKLFNDRYGHQFGDLVLVQISKLLKNATRSKDVVARWGGEEFLVLLPETGGIEAKEVAERMRIAISSSPFYIDDIDVQITMTFGVAECTTNLGINECIDLADKALYQGKKNGRDQVILLGPPESPIAEKKLII